MIHELRNAGFKTLGPAVNVIQALDIIQRDHCDVAVLDINLVSETSETVARLLFDAKIPFLAVSAYSKQQAPEIFKEVPMLMKPIRSRSLITELQRCLD